MPLDITISQMENLLNHILNNEEPMKFAFFIEGEQIAAELAKHLSDFKVNCHRTVQANPVPAPLKLVQASCALAISVDPRPTAKNCVLFALSR